VARQVAPGDLLLLTGGLGAGKTFLSRSVLHALGVEEDEPIQSPTFSLVNEYETDIGPVLHADLYRLRDLNLEVELRRLGLRERRGEGAVLMVEWGEGAEKFLGPPSLIVSLEIISESERRAEISGPKASGLSV